MGPKTLTRRRFTLLTSLAVGGAFLAGCTEPEDPVEPEEDPDGDEGVPGE